MQIRLTLPDSAKDKLKKQADNKMLSIPAYIRTIVAEKLQD